MRENASPSRKNQYSRFVAPVRTNGGELTVADIWPATPRIGTSRADSRCAVALKAATAKVVRLEQQLTERDARIKELEGLVAALERQVELLDARLTVSDSENDENLVETGEHFGALCAAFDDYFGVRYFPLDLRLRIEAVAERLGVVRRW